MFECDLVELSFVTLPDNRNLRKWYVIKINYLIFVSKKKSISDYLTISNIQITNVLMDVFEKNNLIRLKANAF